MLGQENPWTWLAEGMDTRVLECLLGRDREGSTPDSAPMLGASAAVCRSENTPGFTGSELIVTFLSPPLTLCPPYVSADTNPQGRTSPRAG